jgi:hypothetical protein
MKKIRSTNDEEKVNSGRWTVGRGESQAIALVQFAIANLQKKLVHKTLSNHTTKTVIQHLSLFISHSPLKLPSGIFRRFRVPCLRNGAWHCKNQSAAWDGDLRRI